MNVCTYTWMYICMYVCMCLYMYVHNCVFIYLLIYLFIWIMDHFIMVSVTMCSDKWQNDCWMMNHKRIGCKRSWHDSGPILTLAHTKVYYNMQCPGQHLNQALPEYKTEMLLLESTCSVYTCSKYQNTFRITSIISFEKYQSTWEFIKLQSVLYLLLCNFTR